MGFYENNEVANILIDKKMKKLEMKYCIFNSTKRIKM